MTRATRQDLSAVFKEPRLLRTAEEVLNGALVVDGSETGAQTPTLGANKPGTVGGDPGAWVVFTLEGVEWMMPVWRRGV